MTRVWPFRLLRRPATEAESHFRNALRLRDRQRKDFDFGLSIRHFKQAIDLEPANAVFHCHLARAYAAAPLLGVVRGVGTGVKLKESTDLAIAESKEALRLSPDYPDAYLILGEAYMYLGEDDKALQAFESALDLKCSSEVEVHAETEKSQVEVGLSHKPQPDEARKHLERAVVYRDQRKYGRAEAELNKALKCAPDWPWVYRNVCEVAVQAPGSISGTSE